jgi:hypothetical protein
MCELIEDGGEMDITDRNMPRQAIAKGIDAVYDRCIYSKVPHESRFYSGCYTSYGSSFVVISKNM